MTDWADDAAKLAWKIAYDAKGVTEIAAAFREADAKAEKRGLVKGLREAAKIADNHYSTEVAAMSLRDRADEIEKEKDDVA